MAGGKNYSEPTLVIQVGRRAGCELKSKYAYEVWTGAQRASRDTSRGAATMVAYTFSKRCSR
jgi:hypothetical protein